jgi:sirohydrochlorin cobaltochelatase
MRGVLLLAHGARDPAWRAPFDAVVERVRAAAPTTPVALAFLEFMTPELVAAGETLARAGCTTIDVVPLFLGSGGHVRKDVPELLRRLGERCPSVAIRLRPAVGENEGVIEAMARAALE